MLDSSIANPNHTFLTFTTNLDTDLTTPGIQAGVFVMELFDDEAPLTVQNFLRYVQSPDAAKDYIDTFFHRSVSNFVVQGGGFDNASPAEHIEIFQNVHNEFSADRSNLRGTVAMAKTALGPNTATSEWFVNLANNSQNLDNQNGGFTVFGKITDATMPVFDKIAALRTANLGGALTTLPVQGDYNPDPDGNPDTPSPAPTDDQLVKITGIDVAPPQPGNTTGLAYQVISVTDADSGQISNLITTSIEGSKVTLNYTPGTSGVANVTVRVTQGADFVDETFGVTMKPNLIGNIASETFKDIVVQGDLGSAMVTIGNNGAASINTTVNVTLYLSLIGDNDPSGTIVDADDLVIGQLNSQSVVLNGGDEVKLQATITKSLDLVPGSVDNYRVIAKVTPADEALANELFTDDNVAVDGGQHVVGNQFGTIVVQGAKTREVPKLTFNDPATGLPVEVKLKRGVGEIVRDGDTMSVNLENTGLKSVFKVNSAANLAFDDVSVAGAIASADLSLAHITGNIAFSTGVHKLRVGDLSGDNLLIIGAYPKSNTNAKIVLGDVQDLSLESDMRISSLEAVRWMNTDGAADSIFVRSLKKLSITGEAAGIGSPAIAGDLQADVSVGTKTKVKKVSIDGTFSDATFSTVLAKVGKVKIGAMNNAGFFAGTDARPDALDDFGKDVSIKKLVIGGQGVAGPAFIDSQIAAARINSIVIDSVSVSDEASGPFGIVADQIGKYERLDGFGPLKKLKVPGVLDPLPNPTEAKYSVTIL